MRRVKGHTAITRTRTTPPPPNPPLRVPPKTYHPSPSEAQPQREVLLSRRRLCWLHQPHACKKPIALVGAQASPRGAFHPGEKLPSIGCLQPQVRGRVKRLEQIVNDESTSYEKIKARTTT